MGDLEAALELHRVFHVARLKTRSFPDRKNLQARL